MNNSFTTKKFPAVRKASVDLLNAASRKHDKPKQREKWSLISDEKTSIVQ